MDLTQLANLGEFIGGVAVLVTLIYLAVQVGQTKEMMRLESARSTSKGYSAFLLQMMDAGHMELLRKGFDHFESMDPNDQARLHVWFTAMFMAAQTTFAHSKRGATEEGMTQIVEGFNATAVRSPGIAAWWAKARTLFPDDFVRHVDEAALAQEDAPLISEAIPWYRWSGPSNTEAPSR